MRGDVKRALYAGVNAAARSAETAGFTRSRRGYWLANQQETRWELELVFEQEHGEGNFRLEWGVRVTGVAQILEREEIDHAIDCTIAGDVGSLALRQRGMTFIVLSEARAGWLRKALFREVRLRSSDEIADVVQGWIAPLIETLEPLTTRAAVAKFLEDAGRRLGPWFDYPDSHSGRDLKAAAVWALAGDHEAARTALDRWWKSGVDQQFHRAYYKRVAQRLATA
jgi:hypothetical protein